MLHVISLGAGVQSSTMALMAAHGLIGALKPLDQVQFGDTKTADMFGNECEGMCGV